MKHLWLILLISFEFVWAQELKIKINDKTAIIAHNQLILIVSQNYDDFIGRFQKIEDDNIILEGSIIPIDQVREIKLINSEFGSSTGFAQGALTCGSLAAVLISLSYAAFFDSSGRDKSKLSSSFLEEEDLKEVFMVNPTEMSPALLGFHFQIPLKQKSGTRILLKLNQRKWLF